MRVHGLAPCTLTSLLVVFGLAACSDEGAVEVADPTSTEAAGDEGGPQVGDHWHAAIEFSACGERLPVLEDAVEPPHSIHSHGDGLIHIHPSSHSATRDRAVLGVFLDTVGATVTDERIETAKWSLELLGECDGEPAQLMLVEWNRDGERTAGPTVVESAEQIRSVRLDEDGAAIALGLVTADDDVPYPSTASLLAQPVDTGGPPAVGQGTAVDPDSPFIAAPVLGSGGSPCLDTATPDRGGGACYELGPVVLAPEHVVAAEPRRGHEGSDLWTIVVELTAAGTDALNTAAGDCLQRADGCPTGQLALVAFGQVVVAPTVHSDDFASEVVIAGGFTEDEARDLAAAIAP